MTSPISSKHRISSPNLTVEVDAIGGGLTSLRLTESDSELLGAWPSSTGGMTSGFVMAPVISFISDSSKALHQGKTFEPGKHGFARKSAFTVRHKDAQSLVLELTHDPEKSPGIYPFAHQTEVEYTVRDRAVITKLSIANLSDETMYFGAGLHPAFKWPLSGSASKDGYFLCQSSERPKGTLTYRPVDGKIVANASNATPFDKHSEWKLKTDDFEKGAFFFIQPPRSPATTLTYNDENGDSRLCIMMEGWDGFGIWSMPDANSEFICVEPLTGVSITDANAPLPEFKDIKGLRQLKPGESFSAQMHILVL